jgi:radical SAM-linked protein
MKVQRLRVRFSRGEEVEYITHLDLMRMWERILRRADVGLAYSEGFTPHAQLSLAAPLPVGVTSEDEILDVFLETRMTPLDFLRAIGQQLPAGIEVKAAEEVGLRAPSVQSELRAAEYAVSLPRTVQQDDARKAVEGFLAAKSVPWEQARDGQTRCYDIRPLVQDAWLEGDRDGRPVVIGMRLRADSSGSGRPEQVIAAMSLPEPESIHRRRLVLAESSVAHEAWRREGRFI